MLFIYIFFNIYYIMSYIHQNLTIMNLKLLINLLLKTINLLNICLFLILNLDLCSTLNQNLVHL